MEVKSPLPAVSAFSWVPELARGLVKDMRVRWALEEIGQPYSTELFNAADPRPAEYLKRQPFGQVPTLADGDVRIFETGAILTYLGQSDERLLPSEPQARWTAMSWLFAALNSVEPFINPIIFCDLVHADKDWAKEARKPFAELLEKRYGQVETALGDKDWLAGQFSIADIAMVTVLRNLRSSGILDAFPTLSAYKKRGEERPAFQRALDAQMADFTAAQPREMEGA